MPHNLQHENPPRRLRRSRAGMRKETRKLQKMRTRLSKQQHTPGNQEALQRKQWFDCMDCLKAMGERISIAKNHRITCQGSGTGKFIDRKSPEYASKELHEAYNEDTKIREILEDDLKKINNTLRKKEAIKGYNAQHLINNRLNINNLHLNVHHSASRETRPK